MAHRIAEIRHGDCRPGLQTIPDESVRLYLPDPPYCVARANNLETMGRTSIDFDWDKTPLDHETWLSHAHRTLIPWGSVCVWYDFWKMNEMREVLEDLKFDVKRAVLYIKTNPMPRNKTRSPTQTFEAAIWAVKRSPKKPRWLFNVRPEKGYETFVWEEVIPPGGDGDVSADNECLVFKAGVPRTKKGLERHQALKPGGVLRDLIRILSDPGELVVDPFAGQGSVALAAEALGRQHISFEKDEHWYNQALIRYYERTGKHADVLHSGVVEKP
jgi:DNA modification methylase